MQCLLVEGDKDCVLISGGRSTKAPTLGNLFNIEFYEGI